MKYVTSWNLWRNTIQCAHMVQHSPAMVFLFPNPLMSRAFTPSPYSQRAVVPHNFNYQDCTQSPWWKSCRSSWAGTSPTTCEAAGCWAGMDAQAVFSQHIFPAGPRAALCAGTGMLPTDGSRVMRPALPAHKHCRECQVSCDARPTSFLGCFLMQCARPLVCKQMDVLRWVCTLREQYPVNNIPEFHSHLYLRILTCQEF